MREPNADTIVKLANFYNVSTDYLLGHDHNDQDKELTVEAAIMSIK
ncbi:XRE family transcriptional regulator [Lactobacillus delbrueckii]|nr:XRE family transcriptional regulator [Lactobacillus delbrueckii]NVH28801.1 helix-turn-helix transcriptional regulator [Lactobacillus delbrueckii subsp. bulgaricus]NWO31698.1 helix-turn-helix transcriptional regulator [Lactobacillus delbrueckii subsp. bulgaricus]